MKSTKLTPQAAVHAGQIGEVLARTVNASRSNAEGRQEACDWWRDVVEQARKKFRQTERSRG